MRTLILGLPRLVDESWLSILARLEGDRPVYEMITESDLSPLLKAALQPSPKTFAEAVTPDLRAFFTELYSRPEMTDLVWLNLFRIISSRMGREGHVVAIIVYIPMDDADAVMELIEILHGISRAHGVRGDFGFITPLDLGRRAVLEFDYYLDHTCEEEKQRMAGAMQAAGAALESFPSLHPGFLWIKTVFNQGFCRKEGFLYPGGRLTFDHD